MYTNNFVVDTHSLVWSFTENPNLSKKALKAFEKTVKKGSIIIPAVVMAELMYIAKKGRINISFRDTTTKIDKSENFEIIPLDLDILNVAESIECELEMHDRLIVATALFFDVPLITKDKNIRNSGICKTLW